LTDAVWPVTESNCIGAWDTRSTVFRPALVTLAWVDFGSPFCTMLAVLHAKRAQRGETKINKQTRP
jgi:hypothetical protein